MATPLQNGPTGHGTDHESAFTRFGKKLTESRYFMVSLIIHVILVIIAGTIVLFQTSAPVEDFVSAGAVPGIESTIDRLTRPQRSRPSHSASRRSPSSHSALTLVAIRLTS